MKAFFIECSGEIWRAVASELRDQHGWNPVYWTASAEDRDAIRFGFPDCIFHQGTDAARGVAAVEAKDWSRASLGVDLLEALGVQESIALHMMDRMDASGRDFTLEERRRHYYDLLGYWLSVLRHLQPDVVVFSIAPHIVYDFVLYALCRHLGIRTVMFERTGLPGWVYGVSAIDAMPAAMQLELGTGQPTGPFAAYYDQTAQGGEGAVPPNFRKKMQRYGFGRAALLRWPSLILAEAMRFAYLFKTFGFGPLPGSYLKKPGRTPAASRPGVFYVTGRRLAGMWRKAALSRYLAGLEKPSRPGDDFVLYALHYQPERATVPMAGILGDQTLIVDMLADALPEGWLLYVKEHPWQLRLQSRGEMQRSRDFYRRILSRPNVRIVPAAESTDALLHRARAVATVTGSIGWQALCAGIPALVFGVAWYRHCPGARIVRSAEDCRAALAGGGKPDQSAVRGFLAALQAVCVPGVLEPSVEDAAVDMKDAARGMAQALCDALNGPDFVQGTVL